MSSIIWKTILSVYDSFVRVDWDVIYKVIQECDGYTTFREKNTESLKPYVKKWLWLITDEEAQQEEQELMIKEEERQKENDLYLLQELQAKYSTETV